MLLRGLRGEMSFGEIAGLGVVMGALAFTVLYFTR